ncbi:MULTISPECIES: hypothetical protein [Nocardia]|uniref:DUF4345 domain-containing protein n=1 Tax=Nocardia sputorum TaxID=2984338 RepID=A0ABN6U399_9NOCA|nr:hypothetical protein [Nocardia sputorum]BDT90988.1 hypothetical protein IFM12275_09640 [Nocardia sputorum]BDT99620.1 hypothetical protein IFM12276_26490 [Nocardia sputorum]
METQGLLPAAAHSSFTGADMTVMACLLLTAAVIVAGAGLQLVQGARGGEATADHIHRFMAGVYIGWAPMFLLAVPIFLGFAGRMLSIVLKGLPIRPVEFLSFAALEFVLGCVIVIAHALG